MPTRRRVAPSASRQTRLAKAPRSDDVAPCDRGQCFIQVEAAVIDRMRAMRTPGESYSEVILRLVELETSDLR